MKNRTRNRWFKIGALVATLLLVMVYGSCSNAGGGGPAGYQASLLASAIDGKNDGWVNNAFTADEWSGVTPNPTIAFSYAANMGDEGSNDGALKVVYAGENGSGMHLNVFPTITPKTLPASGQVTISAKVKPVDGCVKLATIYVGEASAAPGAGDHETTPAVSLAANAWTTVSLTVTPSSFANGLWRIAVCFEGTVASPAASGGTIYIDDFTVLDYKANDFSSTSQLNRVSYVGSDTGMVSSVQSWGNVGSPAGDGYMINTFVFPASLPAAGLGAWVGADFAPDPYTVTKVVDISHSSMTFRVYLPAAAIAALTAGNSGAWVSIYDGTYTGTGPNSILIWYNALTTLVAGWNTVTINFADPRMVSSTYTSRPAPAAFTPYDYTKATGFDVGFGSGNTPAMGGQTVAMYLDYADIVQN